MTIEIDALRGLDAHRKAEEELVARVAEIDREADGRPFTEAQRAEFEAIMGEDGQLARVREAIAELETREDLIGKALRSGRTETGASAFVGINVSPRIPDDPFDLAAYRQRARSLDELPGLLADGAKRIVDKSLTFPTVDADKGRERLHALIDKHKDEENGAVSRHIISTSSPVYAEAWAGKMSGKPLSAQRQAALQSYSDASGGATLPVQIDPSLILTSDGNVNPLREISRVETIVGKAWRPITTGGMTASYVGERTTTGVADGAPSDLDGTDIVPVRWDTAADVTLEFLQDYGTARILAEIGRLVQDAKDNLEASKFVNGDGTGEPLGLVYALANEAATPNVISTAAVTTFALVDVDALGDDLGERWQARARFLGHRSVFTKARGFGTAGQPAGSIYDEQSGTLRGYPRNIVSTMDTAITANKKILALGDFEQFVIVDRIGVTSQVTPTVDGSGRPTGGTTLLIAGRNTSKPLVLSAFRLLNVKAS